MKKLFAIAVVVAIVVLNCTAALAVNSNTYYSMGEISELLQPYLIEENVGEGDYEGLYLLAIDVLIGESEHSVETSNSYDLIKEFLVQFKLAYEDYLYCNTALEYGESGKSLIVDIVKTNNCVKFDELSGKLSFDLSDDFMQMTIQDIIDANREKELFVAQTRNSTRAVSSSYSGSAAASYAIRYGVNYNSAAYPFYSALEGGDCTNFVSQCLFAGGIPKVGSKSAEGIYNSTTQWYCICTYDPGYQSGNGREYALSTSWIRATDFNTYMTSIANSKTVKTSTTSLYNSCSVGDVVQLLSSAGSPYHTVIISEKTSSGASYCGHTNDTDGSPISKLFENASRVAFFDFT